MKGITWAVGWPQNVRLRSANRGNANNTWNVNSSGYVNNNNAINANRFCPDCVIRENRTAVSQRRRIFIVTQGAERPAGLPLNNTKGMILLP